MTCCAGTVFTLKASVISAERIQVWTIYASQTGLNLLCGWTVRGVFVFSSRTLNVSVIMGSSKNTSSNYGFVKISDVLGFYTIVFILRYSVQRLCSDQNALISFMKYVFLS